MKMFSLSGILSLALIVAPIAAEEVVTDQPPEAPGVPNPEVAHEQVVQERVLTEEEKRNLVLERFQEERRLQGSSFAITPHSINYILPLTHTSHPNEKPFEETGQELQHTEVEFQVSFKVALNEKPLFNDNGFLYFAYTARSFWQAYNTSESSPFRDTNHEPEVFLSFTTPFRALGAEVPVVSIGLSHQSNGRSDIQSRSWNRLYLRTTLEYEKYYFSIKPWWRIPERRKRGPDDAAGDDNPDIHHYLGYFELRGFRRYGDNELSLMLRNNLNDRNKGAIEIGYSYPFAKTKRGYVQLFHGYGESLLDYNHKTTRIGIGFMLNNWL
jgi:phospholipase A1